MSLFPPILLGLMCAAKAASTPQTFTTLFSFNGTTDGGSPVGTLVQGTDGNFYGAAIAGGRYGPGTVFRITPAGQLTTLYSFCPLAGCADGANPGSGLVQATDGNFYGTTFKGGAHGAGTIFKITPSGTLTTLYSFCSQTGCADGANPEAALLQATDGNFYGTTLFGGDDSSCLAPGGYVGCGTIFKITPGGVLTRLYSFGVTDGAHPLFTKLVQGTDGNFYGTTLAGGAYSTCNTTFNGPGCGTIFKITPAGKLMTMHSFNLTDGANPTGLIQATDGNFYGTTETGGAGGSCTGSSGVSPGCGTVFKITPAGALTTLHSFDRTDGANPEAGLVQASNGTFFGTTTNGGASVYGTIFEITPAGGLTTLHSFNLIDGAFPSQGEGLVQATNRVLYGTTYVAGANSTCGNCGTVFSLDLGLPPPQATPFTTYTYHGNSYNTCGGTYCTGGPYALSVDFTAASALANLPYTDITSSIVSFTITDRSGLTVNNSNDFFKDFHISTDASGNIVTWLIEDCGDRSCNIQMQTNWHSPFGFIPGADFSETALNFSGNYGFISGNPGTWTASRVTAFSAAQVSMKASGLLYSRVTRTYNGTVTITNISGGVLGGPFPIVFTSLTPGITLTNATGTVQGGPYINPGVSSLAPGQSITMQVQFSNPSNALINFTPVVY